MKPARASTRWRVLAGCHVITAFFAGKWSFMPPLQARQRLSRQQHILEFAMKYRPVAGPPWTLLWHVMCSISCSRIDEVVWAAAPALRHSYRSRNADFLQRTRSIHEQQ
jgi:hypothetical protein